MAIMGQWNRRTATGVNAALVTLFAIVIASLLVDLSHRYRLRLDTSANAEATLKEDTIAALNQAEESGKQVEIVAFTSQRRNAEARYRNRMMRDLLRELSFQSKAR